MDHQLYIQSRKIEKGGRMGKRHVLAVSYGRFLESTISHFYLHPIGQNLVTWSQLTPRKAGKYNLIVYPVIKKTGLVAIPGYLYH